MKNVRILLSAVLLMITAEVCQADATSDLAKENAELRKRIERLENELEELKKIVMQQAKQPSAIKAEPTPAPVPKLEETDLQKIAAMIEEKSTKKKPVWSNLDIQLYGRLKVDAAYDSSRTTTGNYVKWVDSESTNKNDNEFNLTANETRFGINITGPEDDSVKTSGRVEVDFYGGDAENKSHLMMRHAYMKMDWPEDRFDVIAGQTSDVISPLYPSTLNYSVAWWAGNIGYRRPQIRLTKIFGLNNDVDLNLQGAVARTIGRDDLTDSETGEDAGFPSFQGRVGLTFPFVGYKPTTVGFSSHWGREEYDINTSGGHKRFDSWSINLDLTQPVNKWLTIKGELFTGENLSAYLGGIGQGVNTDTYKEIGSRGGWIAANLGPWDKWSFNIGASIDDVDDDDLTGGSDYKREYNRSIFGNVIYSINKNIQIGFELSQWHTEYKGERDADNLRAQTSLIYNF